MLETLFIQSINLFGHSFFHLFIHSFVSAACYPCRCITFKRHLIFPIAQRRTVSRWLHVLRCHIRSFSLGRKYYHPVSEHRMQEVLSSSQWTPDAASTAFGILTSEVSYSPSHLTSLTHCCLNPLAVPTRVTLPLPVCSKTCSCSLWWSLHYAYVTYVNITYTYHAIHTVLTVLDQWCSHQCKHLCWDGPRVWPSLTSQPESVQSETGWVLPSLAFCSKVTKFWKVKALGSLTWWSVFSGDLYLIASWKELTL